MKESTLPNDPGEDWYGEDVSDLIDEDALADIAVAKYVRACMFCQAAAIVQDDSIFKLGPARVHEFICFWFAGGAYPEDDESIDPHCILHIYGIGRLFAEEHAAEMFEAGVDPCILARCFLTWQLEDLAAAKSTMEQYAQHVFKEIVSYAAADRIADGMQSQTFATRKVQASGDFEFEPREPAPVFVIQVPEIDPSLVKRSGKRQVCKAYLSAVDAIQNIIDPVPAYSFPAGAVMEALIAANNAASPEVATLGVESPSGKERVLPDKLYEALKFIFENPGKSQEEAAEALGTNRSAFSARVVAQLKKLGVTTKKGLLPPKGLMLDSARNFVLDGVRLIPESKSDANPNDA